MAVLARENDTPFYVAAPSSTFDLSLSNGNQIPIEERDVAEVTSFAGKAVAPAGVRAYNAGFDVAEAELITAIITEKGVVESPNEKKVSQLMKE